jgi:hypothetical protein
MLDRHFLLGKNRNEPSRLFTITEMGIQLFHFTSIVLMVAEAYGC